jgi:hypothetical protein
MIFPLILFFLTILIPGYLLLSCWRRTVGNFSPLDLFLAYGLGTFLVSGQIFIYLFIFRCHFSLAVFSSILLVECLAMGAWLFKIKAYLAPKEVFPLAEPLSLSKKTVVSILIILITLNCLTAVINAASRPPVFYDSMAMWSFKAKALFYHQQIDFNPDSYYYLGGGGHLDYPWGVPLAEFWLYSIIGNDNDLPANFIFVAYFFSLLGAIFYFFRRYVSAVYAWIGVFLASSLPLLFFHSSNAYADLPLAFYVLVAAASGMAYWRRGKKIDLIISAVFWAAAAWTKDTAWFFILPVLAINLVIASREKKFKDFLTHGLCLLLLIAPWLAFVCIYGRGVDNLAGFGWHPEVLPSFLAALFRGGSWNIFWYIVFFVLIISWRKIKNDQTLAAGWLLAGLFLAAIVVYYLFTGQYVYAVNQTATSRNLIALAPFCLFLAVISAGRTKAEKL